VANGKSDQKIMIFIMIMMMRRQQEAPLVVVASGSGEYKEELLSITYSSSCIMKVDLCNFLKVWICFQKR
jgi:hypothetical protein